MSNSELAYKQGFSDALSMCRAIVPVEELEVAWSAFKASGKMAPEPEITVDTLVSWYNEGQRCRNELVQNPYSARNKQIAYTIHMWGWASRDLRLALDAAKSKSNGDGIRATIPIRDAIDRLIFEMRGDSSYAWAWHCNFAMPIMDAIGCTHQVANKAAQDLMKHIFGFDVVQLDEWKSLEKQWDEQTLRGSTREEGEAREIPGVKSKSEGADTYRQFAAVAGSRLENYQRSTRAFDVALGAPYGGKLNDHLTQLRNSTLDETAQRARHAAIDEMQKSIEHNHHSGSPIIKALVWLLERAR